MKKLITIILISICFNADAQFYVGFNAGYVKPKPIAGFVLGVKDGAARFQITQLVPLTSNNAYPTLHDATLSIGNKFAAYAGTVLVLDGATANSSFEFSGGIAYYKNTWAIRAGVINKQFKISILCIKLFE